MNLSELAQKNRRVQLWKETISCGVLSVAQKSEISENLKGYQELLAAILVHTSKDNGIVVEEDILKLLNLERKLEQLAEEARLESGKSSLLS